MQIYMMFEQYVLQISSNSETKFQKFVELRRYDSAQSVTRLRGVMQIPFSHFRIL